MDYYIGKLDGRTVSATTAVIIRFLDAQTLEFHSEEEARAFLEFYNRSPSARTQNPGKIYLFNSSSWEEQSA